MRQRTRETRKREREGDITEKGAKNHYREHESERQKRNIQTNGVRREREKRKKRKKRKIEGERERDRER